MNKIEKKKTVKVCVVCGDRANGYNFNAISCESCKAFFRRNALRKKPFKCTFNNNCDINVLSRKFCQKCRLQKCLDFGMNKKLILSDEEKQLMKSKVQENREKKCYSFKENSVDFGLPCSSAFSDITNENTQSTYDSNVFEQKILFHMQENQSIFHNSGQVYMKAHHQNYDKCFLLKNFENIFHNETKVKVNSIAELLAEETVNECGIRQSFPFPANRGLNLLEQNRLNELSSAFSVQITGPITIKECEKHSDVLRMIEHSVRRLIKIMKRIECFRSLCPLDQIALMKGGCTQISILRSVQRYNFQEQRWTVIRNGQAATILTMDFIKNQSISPGFYEVYKEFMGILSEEWESDRNILNLLSLIIFFNANRPDVIHKHLIALEYQSYTYLLRRYLEIKYMSCFEANKKFCKLMNIIKRLHYINEESVRWHLENDPHHIGHLLFEIFDLNY